MRNQPTHLPAPQHLTEGIATVVAIAEGNAWLEPALQSTCSGCASSSSCTSRGIGTIANRLEARRFPLPVNIGLAIGDRVVVGVRPHSIVLASALAYMLPLITALSTAAITQTALSDDKLTLSAMAIGLALGFCLTKSISKRLVANRDYQFTYLRHASTEFSCDQS